MPMFRVEVDFGGTAEFELEAEDASAVESLALQHYTPAKVFSLPCSVDGLELRISRIRKLKSAASDEE